MKKNKKSSKMLLLFVISLISANQVDLFLNEISRKGGVEFYTHEYHLNEIRNRIGNFIDVVNAFKTSTSVTLVKQLSSLGFQYFESSSTMRQIKGLKAQYADQFVDFEMKDLLIPQEWQHGFKESLMLALWTDDQIWTANKLSYSQDAGGSIKTAALFSHNNPPNSTHTIGSTDWFIINLVATYQFSPDIFVYHVSKSVLGGIYTSDEDKIVYMPHNVTPQDITTVFEFFLIVNFKVMADTLGIKVDNPIL
jgi:hypothetical protein